MHLSPHFVGDNSRVWQLIPVDVWPVPNSSQQSSETPAPGPPPVYDAGVTAQSSAHSQHTTESGPDDFGTIVTEVTTVTTTTRKKYRVQDA